VSPVTYPAYKAADVRSAVNGLEAAKERRDAAAQAAEQAALDAAKADIEAENEIFVIEAAERQRQIQINKNKF